MRIGEDRAMRVEELYPALVRSAQGSGPAEKSAEADRARGEGFSDSVSLSRLSQILLGTGPDPARLEQLGRLVASGGYRIAAPELSRRMVAFYLEPDGRQGC